MCQLHLPVPLLLHLGAECNFSSDALSHYWWTDDSQLLSVDSISGSARAGIDTGTTFVNHRGLLASRARVLISRVEKMTLDSSEEVLIKAVHHPCSCTWPSF